VRAVGAGRIGGGARSVPAGRRAPAKAPQRLELVAADQPPLGVGARANEDAHVERAAYVLEQAHRLADVDVLAERARREHIHDLQAQRLGLRLLAGRARRALERHERQLARLVGRRASRLERLDVRARSLRLGVEDPRLCHTFNLVRVALLARRPRSRARGMSKTT
jgi:hypothetical protein